MPPSIKQRLNMRNRPLKSRIVYHEWRHLLFLHWKYDKVEIQKKLPDGLFVDTFDNNAYISIVPFFIQNLQLGFIPAPPFLSNYIEVNVRTYVYDRNGTPGVWFFSLDINSFMATTLSRHLYFLPYYNAKLVASSTKDEISIIGQRKNDVTMEFIFSPNLGTNTFQAPADSLDFFLLERYALFSVKNNQLYSARVHHYPYSLSEVDLRKYKSNLLEINNFQTRQTCPDIIHYCSGVDVDIFLLEKFVQNSNVIS